MYLYCSAPTVQLVLQVGAGPGNNAVFVVFAYDATFIRAGPHIWEGRRVQNILCEGNADMTCMYKTLIRADAVSSMATIEGTRYANDKSFQNTSHQQKQGAAFLR